MSLSPLLPQVRDIFSWLGLRPEGQCIQRIAIAVTGNLRGGDTAATGAMALTAMGKIRRRIDAAKQAAAARAAAEADASKPPARKAPAGAEGAPAAPVDAPARAPAAAAVDKPAADGAAAGAKEESDDSSDDSSDDGDEPPPDEDGDDDAERGGAAAAAAAGGVSPSSRAKPEAYLGLSLNVNEGEGGLYDANNEALAERKHKMSKRARRYHRKVRAAEIERERARAPESARPLALSPRMMKTNLGFCNLEARATDTSICAWLRREEGTTRERGADLGPRLFSHGHLTRAAAAAARARPRALARLSGFSLPSLSLSSARSTRC